MFTQQDLMAENYGSPMGTEIPGMYAPYMQDEDAGQGQMAPLALIAQLLREQQQFDPKLLTPEAADSMGQLGIIPEEQALIESEREYAQALRDTQMPEGHQGSPFYTAASPLEFAGALGHRYLGASRERELMEKQRETLQQQKAIRAQYMTALGRMNGAGGAAPGGQGSSLFGGSGMMGEILRGRG